MGDDLNEVIVEALAMAFGNAVDVTPAAGQPLHVLLNELELPVPWTPSPARALTIWAGWPQNRPGVSCRRSGHGRDRSAAAEPESQLPAGRNVECVLKLLLPLVRRRPGACREDVADQVRSRVDIVWRLAQLLRRPRREPPPPGPRATDVRIPEELFERVRDHVENFSRGEEAGFLIASVSRLADRDVLLAREWLPVPDHAIERNTGGSVLSWNATFNSAALERALALDATLILVHSHGAPNPRFSTDDRKNERQLFGAFSRLLGTAPTGTIVLGKGDAIGSFWAEGVNDSTLGKIVIIGDTLQSWPAPGSTPAPRRPRQRLARQSVAIGPSSDAKLAGATVAVIGISGGGSHIVQQLAHQGVGTIVPIDDQVVDATNLGRVVGAVEADIDKILKVDLAERVAIGIDRSTTVTTIPRRFPSREAVEALKRADVIVACVDRFDVRENINAFARRYMIPLVDIGLAIVSSGERLARADGQVAVALPGRPCLRCWLVTDAVLAAEREHRPPGYDQSPDALGEPQVVSMNGTLASEACNCVLDLITSYSGGRGGAKFWQYDGRAGELTPHPLPAHNPACPACAQEGFGDAVLPM